MMYSKEGDEDPAVTVGNIPEGGGSMGDIPTGSEPGDFSDDFYSDEMPSTGSTDTHADMNTRVDGGNGDSSVNDSEEPRKQPSADSLQPSEERVQE